jgi:hypothetical protein
MQSLTVNEIQPAADQRNDLRVFQVAVALIEPSSARSVPERFSTVRAVNTASLI